MNVASKPNGKVQNKTTQSLVRFQRVFVPNTNSGGKKNQSIWWVSDFLFHGSGYNSINEMILAFCLMRQSNTFQKYYSNQMSRNSEKSEKKARARSSDNSLIAKQYRNHFRIQTIWHILHEHERSVRSVIYIGRLSHSHHNLIAFFIWSLKRLMLESFSGIIFHLFHCHRLCFRSWYLKNDELEKWLQIHAFRSHSLFLSIFFSP